MTSKVVFSSAAEPLPHRPAAGAATAATGAAALTPHFSSSCFTRPAISRTVRPLSCSTIAFVSAILFSSHSPPPKAFEELKPAAIELGQFVLLSRSVASGGAAKIVLRRLFSGVGSAGAAGCFAAGALASALRRSSFRCLRAGALPSTPAPELLPLRALPLHFGAVAQLPLPPPFPPSPSASVQKPRPVHSRREPDCVAGARSNPSSCDKQDFARRQFRQRFDIRGRQDRLVDDADLERRDLKFRRETSSGSSLPARHPSRPSPSRFGRSVCRRRRAIRESAIARFKKLFFTTRTSAPAGASRFRSSPNWSTFIRW